MIEKIVEGVIAVRERTVKEVNLEEIGDALTME